MLVVDELKKNDPHLRLVAVMVAVGVCILLAGLWWVQVVSVHEYQQHLETQAYRSIRLPAVRGKIVDREGRVLAENRPSYNLSLFLNDMRAPFDAAYGKLHKAALIAQKDRIAAEEKRVGHSLRKAELKNFRLTTDYLDALRQQARLGVVNDIVTQVSRNIGVPIVLDPKDFNTHYAQERALPYPILRNLTASQIARFAENMTNGCGVELDMQSARNYPNGTVAAHVLGYLQHDDSSGTGEESFYNYRLPDYKGLSGIEGQFNDDLHGRAGAESVLVNNLGYRQSANVWNKSEPGHNVVLTVDMDIQKAAEDSLRTHWGAGVRGSIVVMDVRNGDILAMVSSPSYDPNQFAQGINADKYQAFKDSGAENNRATHENYAPGSIFKTVVALAALETGLDPNRTFRVDPNPRDTAKGGIFIGRRLIRDTAPPGEYKFQRAFIHSSNSYFVTNGIRAGVENIVRIGQEFHLGERTGLFARQETGGSFPTLDRVRANDWHDGDTANMCIGQGEIAVTPVQMAVMIAAIANGGTVLFPRLVQRIEPVDEDSTEPAKDLPAGLVRDRLTVRPRSLQLVREAMLADVESTEGTGTKAAVPGFRICGKTGTAQVQDGANHLTGYNFWFASFAPYENPRYSVVVMVQSAGTGSGGSVCAPIAHDIYETIVQKSQLHLPAVVGEAMYDAGRQVSGGRVSH